MYTYNSAGIIYYTASNLKWHCIEYPWLFLVWFRLGQLLRRKRVPFSVILPTATTLVSQCKPLETNGPRRFHRTWDGVQLLWNYSVGNNLGARQECPDGLDGPMTMQLQIYGPSRSTQLKTKTKWFTSFEVTPPQHKYEICRNVQGLKCKLIFTCLL